MGRLGEWVLEDLLQTIASPSPTPGGGSVSAVSAALGSALVTMLASLSIDKAQCPDQERIKEILREAEGLVAKLLEEGEKDVLAYNEVMAAYGMPKNTEEEKAERTSKIQQALKKAADAPLEAGAVCLKVLHLAEEAIKKGNKNVISDGVAGGLLAEAAMQSILLNVKVNIGLIKDEEWKKEREIRMRQISQEGFVIRDRLIRVFE